MIWDNVNQRGVFIVWHHRIFGNWKFFITAVCVDLEGTLENLGTAALEGSMAYPLCSGDKLGRMPTPMFIVDIGVLLI